MTFIPAKLSGQSVPKIVQKAIAAGEDFLDGSLLLVDGNGDYAECGADPAAIAAVSLTGAGADTDDGFNRVGRREFPPGFVQAAAVENNQQFHAEYVGALPAAPGGSYGVVQGADGKWRVDFAEITATRVKLISTEWTESPLNRNRVLVSFLAANVQVI